MPPAALVGIHLVRFVGAWFIVLYRRGELPFAFAVPGGWGDVVAAAGAAGILLRGIPRPDPRPADGPPGLECAGSVRHPVRGHDRGPALFRGGGSAAPLTRLPLSLLPTFFVPLIVLSHLRIFGWLRETSD